MVVVWRSGGALVSINRVNLHWARLVMGWVTVFGSNPGAGHLPRYVTSHPGQLSLAIPSWVGAMSTSQRAMTPCGWGVKAGMVRTCAKFRNKFSRVAILQWAEFHNFLLIFAWAL